MVNLLNLIIVLQLMSEIFPYDMRHCVYPHTNPNAVRRTLAANMDVDYNPVSSRTAG